MIPDTAASLLPEEQPGRFRIRRSSYAILAVICLAAVFVTHYGLIGMPYFWDEVGQFVPATWDLYSRGSLVPSSATPNVHPPGIMAWVALWWHVFTPSVEVSRVAMLFLGAGTLFAAFLLAVELCGAAAGLPAFFAVLVLGCSPLFYTQALLVQLDLPSTLFTCLAFWFFFRERHWAAIACCCALVLTKETGALVPLVLGGWLAYEKRFRRASFYLIPLGLLGIWLAILFAQTGHWLGNEEFARYNAGSAARLSHVGFSLIRRAYFLFIGDFHWIGTLGIIAGWRAGVFQRRRWRIAAVFFFAHAVMVSFLGGAVLERYLLPILPLFYAAAVLGLFTLRPAWKWSGFALMTAGLVAALFINPFFWPFPFENNLAMADFTSLHARTASWLEQKASRRTIATAWPLSAELTRPDVGYVSKRLMVLEAPDFTVTRVLSMPLDEIDIFVLYSRDWDPPHNLLQYRALNFLARNVLSYQRPVTGDDLRRKFGLEPVTLFRRGGQWVEIYARPSSPYFNTLKTFE